MEGSLETKSVLHRFKSLLFGILKNAVHVR